VVKRKKIRGGDIEGKKEKEKRKEKKRCKKVKGK
jgi:hypothetical protein